MDSEECAEKVMMISGIGLAGFAFMLLGMGMAIPTIPLVMLEMFFCCLFISGAVFTSSFAFLELRYP